MRGSFVLAAAADSVAEGGGYFAHLDVSVDDGIVLVVRGQGLVHHGARVLEHDLEAQIDDVIGLYA